MKNYFQKLFKTDGEKDLDIYFQHLYKCFI